MVEAAENALAQVTHDILHPAVVASMGETHALTHTPTGTAVATNETMLGADNGFLEQCISGVIIDSNIMRRAALTAVAAVGNQCVGVVGVTRLLHERRIQEGGGDDARVIVGQRTHLRYCVQGLGIRKPSYLRLLVCHARPEYEENQEEGQDSELSELAEELAILGANGAEKGALG